MKKVVTHNGRFHADEIFAIATLKRIEPLEVVRSRDASIIASADYVVDVGGVYDPAKNRFDHHQTGGAGKRGNGIPYSSFGLVWKHFGEKVCGSSEAAEKIDSDLVQAIDAVDNGIDLFQPTPSNILPVTIQQVFGFFRPLWNEAPNYDEAFLNVLQFAEAILERSIKSTKAWLEGEERVLKAYQASKDKRIVFFDTPGSWEDSLTAYPEPLYAVKPGRQSDDWRVEAIRQDHHHFTSRKKFPAAWAGKTDMELQKISGVPDAVFCHNLLFTAGAKSREGAVALATIAANA
jgi:uncharacterized UPF0160 family protein